MTKETMIWQTLSMMIAGMVKRNEIPNTIESFENKAIKLAGSILAYSDEDIRNVLHKYDCAEFSIVLSEMYKSVNRKDGR